jgi:hypothetical protein
MNGPIRKELCHVTFDVTRLVQYLQKPPPEPELLNL